MENSTFPFRGHNDVELEAIVTPPAVPPPGSTIIVFIPGLTEGPLDVGLSRALADAAAEAEPIEKVPWSAVVHPRLTSSGMGFGRSSIEIDAEELESCINEVIARLSPGLVVVVGHSTGCQDIVALARRCPAWFGKNNNNIVISKTTTTTFAAVLQAPVSDVEYAEATDPDLPSKISAAENALLLFEGGKGSSVGGGANGGANGTKDVGVQQLLSSAELFTDGPMLAEPVDGAEMSAARFLSLHTRGTSEDVFSARWSDAELSERLSPLGVPALVAWAAGEQYALGEAIRRDPMAHAQRLASAIPGGGLAVCLPGNHALVGNEAAFVDAVAGFVRGLGIN